jgi:putative ABC transport system ATP-binding protein
MKTVKISKLGKVYRQGKIRVVALDDVSLDFDVAEFTALAGPSGSGKTTLLNMIGGLDHPDNGNINVDGRDISMLSKGELAELRLRRIGFVFQAYNLIPVLTAAENVEYVLRLQGVGRYERRERVWSILKEVGLDGKENRKPAELSGGQQQRVAVARALVSNPAIVLADEPTANLDSSTGEQLLDLMRLMNREKSVTFIFSTHDTMVMEYASRIVRLHDGRVEQDERKAS